MPAGRFGLGAAAELAQLARTVARRAAGEAPEDTGSAEALPAGEAATPSPTAELGTTLAGALFEAADLTRDATATAWRATEGLRGMAGWLAQAPPVRPVTSRVEATVERWRVRGETETEAGRIEVRAFTRAAVDEVTESEAVPATVSEVVDALMPALLPGIIDMLAEDPKMIGGVVDSLLPDLLPGIIGKLSDDPTLIGGVVDALLPDLLPEIMDSLGEDPTPILGLVNAIMPPLLAELLPVVVEQLGEDPEPIRDLVMGQSTSIAGEMVENVRSRAVTGDERAERLVRKLLLKKPRPELAATPTPQLGTGAPTAEEGR